MNAGLVEVLRYNRWANLTLLEACRELTADQLRTQPPAISDTMAALLMHLVGGQQTFVLRTKGRQHEGELNRDSAWPGMDAIIKIARTTSDELIAIAEAFEDTEVGLPYMGKSFRYPVRFFLTHAVAHGAEHRTEIKIALLQLGIKTPDLDAWQFAEAMGYGAEIESPQP